MSASARRFSSESGGTRRSATTQPATSSPVSTITAVLARRSRSSIPAARAGGAAEERERQDVAGHAGVDGVSDFRGQPRHEARAAQDGHDPRDPARHGLFEK
ncbi:hypothetical protein [Nonomuraea sp. GTA35]|uniref:hypothetical protein n=1 Tax=Nonomuraea sp. GTA35 TaxID=1676746 RepID=UPI0035BFBEB8